MEQDLQFGEKQDHSQTFWGHLLGHEVGGVNTALVQMLEGRATAPDGMDVAERLRSKLLDVAAVATAAIESFDREYEEKFGNITA